MNHVEEYTLNSALPNLDCYVSPDEVAEAAKELESVAEGIRLLVKYAEFKQDAMHHRLKGNINQALHREKNAQNIYDQLPGWAKW
jgi:hypothetical protein